VNNRRKSILLIVFIFLLLLGGISLFLLTKSDKSGSSSDDAALQTDESSSPFAQFAESSESTDKKTPVTKEFIENLTKKAKRIAALTQFPEFVNTNEYWKSLLEQDQHFATVECPTGDVKFCNVDFVASTIPDFTSKYYPDISMSRTCPLAGTAYVVDNTVYIHSDNVSLANYLNRPIKLIASFNKAVSPFENDSLPKAEECIYYVE